MPFITYDLPTLVAQCRAYFRAQFPSADQSSAGYFGQLSAVLAMVLLEAQNELLQVDQDWPPTGSSYTPGRQSSPAALDQAGVLLGLPDGQGGFGRLKATISSGGAGLLIAPATTVYSNGLLLKDSTNQVTVQLSGAVTIPVMMGSAVGRFVSVTTGTAANLPVVSVLTFQTPPAGAQATVTLGTAPLGASPLTGGTDQETDAALLTRIYDRLRNPRTGGKSSDWKDWLVTVQAVKQIYVYPKRSGTGTVDSVLSAGGSGLGRIPSAQTLADATAAYQTNRPVCSQFNVLPVAFRSGRGLTIRSLALPTLSKYKWDWTSGAGTVGYRVTAFTAGSPAILQINGDINTLSPSLKQAIDRGATPRIQVSASNGPVVPSVVTVTAYQVVAGPKTNLTLGTLPAGWVNPVANNTIYPAGPISVNQLDATLGPIQKSAAQHVLELVDTLGPSRQSGYADDFYYWDDTLRIDDIKAAIIDQTLDLDGTPMVRTTGNSPLSDTTIQIGTGMPGALDFETTDATPGQPPEYAVAILVIVTGP